MKQFLLLYKGPATPPDASHTGWPEWFAAAGTAIVDRGSAMVSGHSITKGGSAPASVSISGYSILQGANQDGLQPLISNHPYIGLGDGYSIEVFELPGKEEK